MHNFRALGAPRPPNQPSIVNFWLRAWSHLCTANGCEQFRKESETLQTRIMFERYYSFFHYCLLSCGYAMFQKDVPKMI